MKTRKFIVYTPSPKILKQLGFTKSSLTENTSWSLSTIHDGVFDLNYIQYYPDHPIKWHVNNRLVQIVNKRDLEDLIRVLSLDFDFITEVEI